MAKVVASGIFSQNRLQRILRSSSRSFSCVHLRDVTKLQENRFRYCNPNRKVFLIGGDEQNMNTISAVCHPPSIELGHKRFEYPRYKSFLQCDINNKHDGLVF